MLSFKSVDALELRRHILATAPEWVDSYINVESEPEWIRLDLDYFMVDIIEAKAYEGLLFVVGMSEEGKAFGFDCSTPLELARDFWRQLEVAIKDKFEIDLRPRQQYFFTLSIPLNAVAGLHEPDAIEKVERLIERLNLLKDEEFGWGEVDWSLNGVWKDER